MRSAITVAIDRTDSFLFLWYQLLEYVQIIDVLSDNNRVTRWSVFLGACMLDFLLWNGCSLNIANVTYRLVHS